MNWWCGTIRPGVMSTRKITRKGSPPAQIKTAASVNYTYDGDGDRVEKSNGKIYWYGTGSDVLDESDLSGNITDEYIFFGGKRIAHRRVADPSARHRSEPLHD